MARFFQYIDKNDETKWNSVTELAYIDDTDPDMIMYHFTDGTKCNKDFIGSLNDTEAIGKYVMVEVENRTNIWKIEKNVLEYKERTVTTANGETVTVPDLYMTDTQGNFKEPGIRYNFIPPKKSDKPVGSFTNYYLSGINEKLLNNETVNPEIIKNIPTNLLKVNVETKLVPNNTNVYLSKNEIHSGVTINETDNSIEDATLSVDKYIATNSPSVQFYKAMSYDLETLNYGFTFSDDVIKNGITVWQHIKITDKSNNKIIFEGTSDKLIETLCTPSVISNNDTSYDVINKLDKDKYALVSNMINAANKDECEVNLTMGLKLPPTEVYDVLKKVYGDEYAHMFVLNLAYNLPDEQIRQAIAAGLSAYYNPVEDEVKTEEYDELPFNEDSIIND